MPKTKLQTKKLCNPGGALIIRLYLIIISLNFTNFLKVIRIMFFISMF